MLGPGDLGHRVVLRRAVGERNGRPLFTDALGVLTSVTEQEFTIDTERGPLRVDRRTVVAGKRVPPRPPRRAPLRETGADAD